MATMYRWICEDCGVRGALQSRYARAQHSSLVHGRVCGTGLSAQRNNKINYAEIKMRFPSCRGLSDQDWVDRWEARPDLFLRLVRYFETVARNHPLPRREADHDQVAI